MADSWNTLLSNRASRDYSLLPTQFPSEDARNSRQRFSGGHGIDVATYSRNSGQRFSGGHGVDVADYSCLQSHHESHTLSEDDHDWHKRNSGHHVKIAPLGQRVSRTSLNMTEADVPLRSPKMGKTATSVPMGMSRTTMLAKNSKSCWRFVDTSWFQAISAVVIISNVITTIVQMDKPQTKSLFFVSDQIMLVFYVVEFFSRANYLGSVFLCGPCDLVGWNVLDIIVVVAGVLDQWIMPALPVRTEGGPVSKVLTLLRLLRLLRVFKIIRVFLDIDLSWTEAPAFQSFIGIVIMINSVLMGVEIDIQWSGWFYFEQVLLCIYVFELSVRLKNFGKFFFSCSNADIVWNVLDFLIVTSSVLDSWLTPLCGVIVKSIAGEDAARHKKGHGISLGKVMMLMRMLRLMRILRLAKLVKSIQPLYILVTGVMAALQGVAWVLVLTIVTLYAMGILATSLIGKKMGFPPGASVPEEILKPFNTVPNSMFTLFRVMSGAASDAESVAIDDLMSNVPALKLCFVFFMITSSWTLLSILTAVVSDNMISTTGAQEEEIKIQNAEEDRCEHVERLTELFNTIDVGGDGQVERDEIETFLSDRDNALLTARRCRVPVRDVREVLQTVAEACEGTTVSIETFVEHLADVSNVVTQKSVMKIEAMLTNIGRESSEGFRQLRDQLASWQEKANNNSVSKLNVSAEASSKAMHTKAESASKDQLQDVKRLMQGLAERTEASLNEHLKNNQRLIESMTGVLERSLPKFEVDKISEILESQLSKMQHDLVCNVRGQEPDIAKFQKAAAVATLNLMPDQEASAMQKQLNLHDIAGPSEAIKRDIGEEPLAANESQTNVVDIARASGFQRERAAAGIELRLLAIEASIHESQQNTESVLRRIEHPLQKMSTAVDQGFSALSVDNFTATWESELRMIRQELLLYPMRQSPDISKAKGTTESDKQLAPDVEIQRDLAGVARASSIHVEVLVPPVEERLLATEKSIDGLQRKADAMLDKIEGLLKKAVDMTPSDTRLSTCALDKIPETCEGSGCPNGSACPNGEAPLASNATAAEGSVAATKREA